MKNDFRNDGTQNVGWLADQGAREGDFDGQGFLIENKILKATGPVDRYDEFKDVLYRAALDGKIISPSSKASMFAKLGYEDLAHMIEEGRRDRLKLKTDQQESRVHRSKICKMIPQAQVYFSEKCPITLQSWDRLFNDGWIRHTKKGSFPCELNKYTSNTIVHFLGPDGNMHMYSLSTIWGNDRIGKLVANCFRYRILEDEICDD